MERFEKWSLRMRAQAVARFRAQFSDNCLIIFLSAPEHKLYYIYAKHTINRLSIEIGKIDETKLRLAIFFEKYTRVNRSKVCVRIRCKITVLESVTGSHLG
jgi:hypothetical protein